MPKADPLQTTVYFPLTVDSDLSLTAQALLRRECGAQIRSISLEPNLDKHEMRLWVTVAAAAYGLALHAIILGLPAAEFGPVKTAKTDIVTVAMAA